MWNLSGFHQPLSPSPSAAVCAECFTETGQRRAAGYEKGKAGGRQLLGKGVISLLGEAESHEMGLRLMLLKYLGPERACLDLDDFWRRRGSTNAIRDAVWLLSRHPKCNEDGDSAGALHAEAYWGSQSQPMFGASAVWAPWGCCAMNTKAWEEHQASTCLIACLLLENKIILTWSPLKFSPYSLNCSSPRRRVVLPRSGLRLLTGQGGQGQAWSWLSVPKLSHIGRGPCSFQSHQSPPYFHQLFTSPSFKWKKIQPTSSSPCVAPLGAAFLLSSGQSPKQNSQYITPSVFIWGLKLDQCIWRLL